MNWTRAPQLKGQSQGVRSSKDMGRDLDYQIHRTQGDKEEGSRVLVIPPSK